MYTTQVCIFIFKGTVYGNELYCTCMCVHATLCTAMYVGLQRNNPMGIATCTGTCTCSYFAREGSMLYTENQSDENWL